MFLCPLLDFYEFKGKEASGAGRERELGKKGDKGLIWRKRGVVRGQEDS